MSDLTVLRKPIRTVKKQQVRLTPQELEELKLRRAVLDQARGIYQMVEEAYTTWARQLRDKYGLTAKYDVDLVTGKITQEGEKDYA